MTNDEWADADDPRVRALCGYALRAHVRYQDGRDSLAPALVFADADYEVGDGTCGLHSDGKQANEPAIVYIRVDSLIDAIDHAQADKETAVAAEREAIIQLIRNDYPLSLVEDIRCEILIDEIRARGDTDALAALERVRQEAKAEALREAAETARRKVECCQSCASVELDILALIPDQHKETEE